MPKACVHKQMFLSGRYACTALLPLAFVLSACSFGLPQLPSFSLQSTGLSLPSVETQRQQLASGVTAVRQGFEGAYEVTIASAGGAVRRINARLVSGTDTCLSEDSAVGCAPAAVNACRRAGFAEGTPLATSTYSACRGGWGLAADRAPADACKTKRRINSALCW